MNRNFLEKNHMHIVVNGIPMISEASVRAPHWACADPDTFTWKHLPKNGNEDDVWVLGPED